MKKGSDAFAIIRRAAVATLSASILFLNSCGKIPTRVDRAETGDLEIRALVSKNLLAKTTATHSTEFDSLIVEISASDFPLIHFSKKIDLLNSIINDTFPKIPAGENRTVSMWTCDKDGNIIHTDSVSHRTVKIDPGSVAVINAKLIPAAGSIYLQIGNVPTSVDSIFAAFKSESDNKIWTTRVKRAPKVYFSIDKITHNTKGSLLVVAVDSRGDTLFRAERDLVFKADETNAIDLQFEAVPGGSLISISLVEPGATLVSIDMEGNNGSESESGRLIITEIMYSANDSEYVEVYNPENDTFAGDTLLFDIDGTLRIINNVLIPPKGIYVIGRKAMPWVDNAFKTASALDLSSNGNWIILKDKDGTVMDRVIFTGGTNDLEWPSVSGKRSIVLNTSALNSSDNNFGKNWSAAQTLIEGTTQYGSPHQL